MTAAYASDPDLSRGRAFSEPPSPFRTCFQRDHDRILHSSAFRRLKAKTQVFLADEGDFYRTRLTHTLEVAQVSRTMATTLGLNQDLSMSIALAHDLGHTPFGHTGEDALDELMAPYGGFDHNAQAVKIVTSLEKHYASFDGLNLCWETLEGIAKHNGPIAEPAPFALAQYCAHHDLELHTYGSGEAQVAAISDDIAYNNHDLQDGLKAGFFDERDLADVALWVDAFRQVADAHPGVSGKRRRHEALRRVFGAMVVDAIETTKHTLEKSKVRTAQDIRNLDHQIVCFSPTMQGLISEVREFLFEKMYRAPEIVEKRREAADIVRKLFKFLIANPDHLPQDWRPAQNYDKDETTCARAIADYLAGMTDTYAISTYRNLIDHD